MGLEGKKYGCIRPEELYEDSAGRTRCNTCHLLVTTAPVTCEACISGAGHARKRGKPPFSCSRSRCQGHRKRRRVDQEEEPLIGGRWRRRTGWGPNAQLPEASGEEEKDDSQRGSKRRRKE